VSLFVVKHQHPAGSCPAQNREMAPMLARQLSPANAQQHGLLIQAEAVVNNAHTLYLIVDAADQESVTRFMQPFAQAGSVEVLAASSCEAVIARGGCALV